MTPQLRILPTPTRPGDTRFLVPGNTSGIVAALQAAGQSPQPQPDGTLAFDADRAAIQQLLDLLPPEAASLRDALRHWLTPARSWKLRTRDLPLTRPRIMGILNLTTDSFSGDGVGHNIEHALRHAASLRDAGADIIDVGAESARADRPEMIEEQEAELVAQAIAALSREGHCLSSDTYKPLVARAALASGAEIINDISGLTIGTGAAEAAAAARAAYILNYSYSPPKRRPTSPPRYTDVVTETITWFEDRLARLQALGLPRHAITIDPGIAFGKSHDEDIQIIRRLGELTVFGNPLLLAHSRKNYIGSITGRPPEDRDLETHATIVMAVERGAHLFRVHDVAGARRAADFAAAIATSRPGDYAPGPEDWPWAAGARTTHASNTQTITEAPKGQRW